LSKVNETLAQKEKRKKKAKGEHISTKAWIKSLVLKKKLKITIAWSHLKMVYFLRW
jgi:uncharacterized Zn finger protein